MTEKKFFKRLALGISLMYFIRAASRLLDSPRAAIFTEKFPLTADLLDVFLILLVFVGAAIIIHAFYRKSKVF